MKNLLKKAGVFLFALTLMSCDIKYNTSSLSNNGLSSENSTTSSVDTSFEDTSSEVVSNDYSNLNLKTLTINLDTVSSGSSYATNFNNGKYVNGIELGGYRIGTNYSIVYPYHFNYKNTSYEGREGSVYNVSSIGDIYTFEINYTAINNYGYTNPKKPSISFGFNMQCNEYSYNLQSSSSYVDSFVDVGNKNCQYFSINTGDYLLGISSITIKYLPTSTTITPIIKASGEDKVRINPVRFKGTLEPGVSKVTVPTSYEYDEKTASYVGTSSKELTYYSYYYVKNHPEVKDDATITDPLEVCMYYTAFGAWPANYSFSPKSISSIFGSDTRKVSKYNRTDGYALSVPWNGSGYYYELDIDFDGTYSTSSRGTGRVVAWDSGWSNNYNSSLTATGYDSSPVCVYTDDHYCTWLEYLNNGTWSNRFNGEGKVTGVSYSPAKTVTLSNFETTIVDDSTSINTSTDEENTSSNNDEEISSSNMPVDNNTIDHSKYYANRAPEILVNESTALYQKVTSLNSILFRKSR